MSGTLIRAAAGVLFVAALAVVYFDGYDVTRTGYEAGEMAGRALRNVSIGLLLGFAGNLLIARRQRAAASWDRVTSPTTFAAGGVVAVVLGIAFGAPATSAEREYGGCEDDLNPATALPSDYVELDEQQKARLLERSGASGEAAIPEGLDASIFVKWEEGIPPTVVSTLEVGDDAAHEDFESGFITALRASGGRPVGDLPGNESTVYANGGRTVLIDRADCFEVIITASSRDAAAAASSGVGQR